MNITVTPPASSTKATRIIRKKYKNKKNSNYTRIVRITTMTRTRTVIADK